MYAVQLPEFADSPLVQIGMSRRRGGVASVRLKRAEQGHGVHDAEAGVGRGELGPDVLNLQKLLVETLLFDRRSVVRVVSRLDAVHSSHRCQERRG